MTFGERFKQTLEQKGISQKQFAHKMNISESAVSDYINYRRLPNILLAREMAKELGVSVDYLLDYEPKNILLEPDEETFIERLRSMTKERKDILTALAEILAEK